MGGNGFGDALAAAQPSADELVGVCPVDLSTGRTLGCPASLASNGQDAAGFVDGGIAVDQFSGAPVDVIDAATEQNRLQASSGVPGSACREGMGGQRLVLLSSGPCGQVDERRQPSPGAEVLGSLISGAVPHLARSGLPAAQGVWGVWLWHRDRAPGDSPARHFTVIPRNGGSSNVMIPVF